MSIRTLSMRLTFLSALIFFSAINPLLSQDKYVLSARKSLEQHSYKKVIKLAERALDKDKTQAEWWYLKSSAEYELSLIPKYQGGKVNYEKNCIKSAVKAMGYDPNKEIYPEYSERMVQIALRNNKEAMANYAKGSWAKAIQLYKISYDLTGDTIALGMLGLSYWGDKKEMDAMHLLRQVTRMNYGAKLAGWGDPTFIREPFEILSTYFLEKKMYDSALYYTEMGLEIYFMSRVLLANEMDLLKNRLIQISRSGLTEEFISVVNKGLHYYPGDSFFLYEQNYYFLTVLNNATRSKPYDSADEKFYAFYKAKKSLVDAGINNPSDEFLISDSTAFAFKCLDYFLRTNTKYTAPYFFKKWYVMFNKLPEYDVKLAESLLKNPPDKISRRMVVMLFEDAEREYPWNKNFKKYRLTYFNNWMKKPKRKGELVNLLEMNEAVIKDYPADKTLKSALQTNLIMIFDSTLQDGNMYKSWRYYNKLKEEFPTTKNLDSLQKKLAMADFNARYSDTRIHYFNEKGKKTPNLGWDGNSAMCQAGNLPDSTLQKVLHRINYFRQNSGIILPMNLSYDRTQKCQEAAVMYSGKGIFSREPTDATHRCFTDNAKIAAKVAQAILEPNPAQCITVFMADKKSEELVNRLSILNPEGLDVGFGCAENNCVFWLLDVDGAPDSLYYRTHFVAWPPPGYSPAMLFFNKWNFSMAADLRDAMVTIKDKKGEFVVFGATRKPLPGMLLETLIIETNLDPKKAKPGDYYDVLIELKDKRKFNYRINLF